MTNEGHPNSTIIKQSPNPNTDIVAFVGNGAIKGGSIPLREALDLWIGNDQNVAGEVTRLRKQDREAFHQLAIMSYKFKVARGLLFVGWMKSKNGDSKLDSIQESSQKALSPLITNFLGLRANIAQSFKNLQPSMTLRRDDEIDAAIGLNAQYITTNWDNTLWADQSVKNLIHLHGRCDYPDSMIFPTELVIEDTPFDFSVFKSDTANVDQAFAQAVVSTFRSSFIEPLLAAQVAASHLLKPVKRLIIWGYSLGDYDADVNALIGTYTPDNASGIELIVINPDPAAFHRAVALTGITNAKHYNPVTQITMTLKS